MPVLMVCQRGHAAYLILGSASAKWMTYKHNPEVLSQVFRARRSAAIQITGNVPDKRCGPVAAQPQVMGLVLTAVLATIMKHPDRQSGANKIHCTTRKEPNRVAFPPQESPLCFLIVGE
jgi:hypothetical protein